MHLYHALNSFLRGVEINAIHAFHRRQSCHFFTRVGVHDDHLRRRACAHEQPVIYFVKGPIAVSLSARGPRGHDLTLFGIDD